MRFINRFTALFKRILTKKIYIVMLCLIVAFTAIYKLLPAREKSADIKVGIYCEDASDYSEQFEELILSGNKLYRFYFTDSEAALLTDIQSGQAECGYVIPEGFFSDYIADENTKNHITLYSLPSTTLAAAITETFYYNVLRVCSYDILIDCTDLYEYRDEVISRMNDYLSGDAIFRMSDLVNGSYDYKTFEYRIQLPIYEMILLLVLFSAMLGLYAYIKDAEKGIYAAIKRSELFELKTLYLITAILPILIVGLICLLIASYRLSYLLMLLAYSLIIYIATYILSLIIRRSTLLSKVLPIIMFIALIITFILYLI